MENWREVFNAPNYEVSDLGNVRKRKNGEMVHQTTDWDGYKTVSILYDGKWTTKSVHRLVATAFLGLPESKMQVNHKDGIKDNNHIDNLEWVTQSENILHSYNVLGRKKRQAKKGGGEVLINLKLFRIAKHLTQGEMADKCNVSRAVYSNIERGRNEAKGDFWDNLQAVFSLSDGETRALQKKDVTEV